MSNPISRRDALKLGGVGGAVAAGAAVSLPATAATATAASANAVPGRILAPVPNRVFDVRDHEAIGDGYANDTAALQAAIDACAAAGGGQVLVSGARCYRTGTIYLRDRVQLYLDDQAMLQASLDQSHYAEPVLIVADGATGVSVAGTGSIDGRSQDFMKAWNDTSGWGPWEYTPASWRPKMFEFRACTDVTVRDITFGNAPQWGLHLMGCDHVLVEQLTVRNNLEVPNCDGVDIDRSRDVEVSHCRLWAGDDSVVVKASKNPAGRDFGSTDGVHVHDCELTSQSAALKVGTETNADISNVLFELCTVHSSNRACSIQLRDSGNVSGVTFRGITFDSRYFSDPWWGHGEALSVTAIPRTAGAPIGTISDVRFERITGTSENSLRIDGSAASRPRSVVLQDVRVTMTKWSSFPGGVYDNRPTTVLPGLQQHATPAFHLGAADDVTLENCAVSWGPRPPDYYSYALEVEDVTGLVVRGFTGTAAHPGLPAVRKSG